MAEKLAIGIDLGGSKISGVLIDENGKVLTRYVRPTEPFKTKTDIIDNILGVINLLNKNGVVGIGLAAPGFFDKQGRLKFIPNVQKLYNVNLKKIIEQRMKLPVSVNNDAKCFALAEHRLGAGKGKKNMVGVVVGTGIGSGIIINGEIYNGAIGGAGEIGHTKLRSDVGHMIEAEKLIAGPAFLKKYEARSGKNAKSIAEIPKSSEAYKRTYHEFTHYLSILFANLINTLNPELIVVGGGLSHIDFYKDVEKKMKHLAVKELGAVCSLKKNKLGADSGCIGAALLALDNF